MEQIKNLADGIHVDGHRLSCYPERCPITGAKFFMVIDFEGSPTPTYGGPYDSYTIPEVCNDEGELSRWRYDHDEGGWVEMESIGKFVVDEDILCELDSLRRKVEAAEKALQ